jgi:hypothetical protein
VDHHLPGRAVGGAERRDVPGGRLRLVEQELEVVPVLGGHGLERGNSFRVSDDLHDR